MERSKATIKQLLRERSALRERHAALQNTIAQSLIDKGITDGRYSLALQVTEKEAKPIFDDLDKRVREARQLTRGSEPKRT